MSELLRGNRSSLRIVIVSTIVILVVFASGTNVLAKTPAGTIIESTAEVSWEDEAENPYDEQATINVEVLPVAGVSVDALTSATRVVSPDNSLVHEVKLTNTGNFTDDFDLTIDLDPNAIADNWTFSVDGGPGLQKVGTDPSSYRYAGLGQDDDVILSITVKAPADAVDGDSASLSVRAVSSFDSDVSVELDNIVTYITDTYLRTTITAERDGVLLDPATDTVEPGDLINYTVDIFNEGTGNASDITVSHKLPDNVTLDEDSIKVVDDAGNPIPGYDVTYDPATGTIVVVSDEGVVLAGGNEVQIKFDVTVDQFTEPDEILQGEVDVEYKDSSDTVQTPPPYNLPELKVDELLAVSVVSDSPSTTAVGSEEVEGTFIVTNEGNITDNMVISLDEAPVDPSIWSLYRREADGTLTDVTAPVNTGDLLPGESVEYVVFAVAPAEEDGWSSTVTLTATSTQDASVTSSDSFMLELSAPKLLITLEGVALGDSGVNDPIELQSGSDIGQIPGAEVEFTVTVTNNGRESAQQVQVIVPVPENTTFVSDSLVVIQNLPSFTVTYESHNNRIYGYKDVDFGAGDIAQFNFRVVID